jgi:hypothetical protein
MKWQSESYKTDFMVRQHKMGIEILADSIKLSAQKYPNDNIVIQFSEMPDLLRESRQRDPLTRILTKFAENFVKKDLPVRKTFLFVRAVNAWGGLRGANPSKIWEQNKDNNFSELQKRLVEAMALIQSDKPKEAIAVLQNLDGIGISFGSKYLRFLCPNHAVVLDQKIRDRTDLREKSEDYEKFVRICQKIRSALQSTEMSHLGMLHWRLADVEASIFMAIAKNPLSDETKLSEKEKRAEKRRRRIAPLSGV